MDNVLPLSFIGMISGICAGFIGAGAEILIVPLLALLGVYDSMKTRVGTSLVMILPPIGIFATYKYFQNGYVDIKGGLYMAFLFTIFSFLSARYSVHLNQDIFRKIFAVFTILMGIYLFISEAEESISTSKKS